MRAAKPGGAISKYFMPSLRTVRWHFWYLDRINKTQTHFPEVTFCTNPVRLRHRCLNWLLFAQFHKRKSSLSSVAAVNSTPMKKRRHQFRGLTVYISWKSRAVLVCVCVLRFYNTPSIVSAVCMYVCVPVGLPLSSSPLRPVPHFETC